MPEPSPEPGLSYPTQPSTPTQNVIKSIPFAETLILLQETLHPVLAFSNILLQETLHPFWRSPTFSSNLPIPPLNPYSPKSRFVPLASPHSHSRIRIPNKSIIKSH
ncbi:hypothetical protein MANES_17G029705v8 [Manihot esculenta]|uniref:Uncharacterized protein n=1 Tax=Manihot esculenta TaxID=3983 RepID=A0ACB7G2H5_MANES|nr:hypothetical protein MANES_17G029705v8 [Manihot esculenta]